MARSSHDSRVCQATSSNSIPGLAVFNNEEQQSKTFKIFEFVDELALKFFELRWNIVFKMDFPFHEPLHSSTDGLPFLCERRSSHPCDLFLCNPVNREYIKLPSPQQHCFEPWVEQMNTFGFGVSRITGQYKVVRMFLDEKLPQAQYDRSTCQVYSIGTGLWRRIASCMPLVYIAAGGTFLNGNLHFLAIKDSSILISCLDLETELFNTLSTPPLPYHYPLKIRNLSVVRGCLCVCDNSADEIDIWLMKEYGDVKSWTKEFAISNVYEDGFVGNLCPLKVFKNGDILLMELERTNQTAILYQPC